MLERSILPHLSIEARRPEWDVEMADILQAFLPVEDWLPIADATDQKVLYK